MTATLHIPNTIEHIATEALIPYARNSRTHSPEQVAQLARSIQEFGFTNPVLIDEHNTLIAGHGRVMAAQRIGLPVVPAIRLAHLSEAQRRAYVIADNQLALQAGWDTDILALELGELQADGFDLALTGFDADELAGLLLAEEEAPTEGLTTDDETPDVMAKAVSTTGDVWKLGKHRVMCGDSTRLGAIESLMDGEKADLTFTSPPYNANTKAGDGDIFTSKKKKKLYSDGYSDNLSSREYINFAKNVLNNCFLSTNGFIFWNVSYNANSRFEYIKQIEDRLPYLIEQICWKKSSTIPFKGSLMRDWEPIFLFSTHGEPLGLEKVVSNFWEISNTNSQTENHKACFPVGLPEKGISIVRKILESSLTRLEVLELH